MNNADENHAAMMREVMASHNALVHVLACRGLIKSDEYHQALNWYRCKLNELALVMWEAAHANPPITEAPPSMLQKIKEIEEMTFSGTLCPVVDGAD